MPVKKPTAKQVVQLKKKTKKHMTGAKKKLISTEKKLHAYMKRHPERAALVASAVSAAVSAGVTAAFIKHKKKRQ